MKIINLMEIAVIFLILAPCCRAQCSNENHGKRGNYLMVKPTDGLGSVLGRDFYVKEFVDLRSNVDRANLFGRHRKGSYDRDPYLATKVPYGIYRIKLQSRSGSDSFGRVIEVCRKDETVDVPNHFARVHIVLLNETLNTVEAAESRGVKVTQCRNAEDQTEMASLFKGVVAEQVPYGHYDIEFLVPLGFVARHVDVLQPDV